MELDGERVVVVVVRLGETVVKSVRLVVLVVLVE